MPAMPPNHNLGMSTTSTRRGGKHVDDPTLFGYESPPDLPALPAQVYRWIQSLDLSHSLRHVRRDVANGFIVAEIFSRYFPADIQMHGFANATSSHYKRDNWAQLQRFCEKQGIELPPDLVEGSITGLHGAAASMLEYLYTLFTSKKLPRMASLDALDPSAMASTGGFTSSASAAQTDRGPKAISAAPKANQNLEFGAVQTQGAGDAIALRRRLAAGG